MTNEELQLQIDELKRRMDESPAYFGMRTTNALQSPNFATGSSGWRVQDNGDVEFNDGTFRGALSANTIDIGGSDATSFHVDVDGNMWAGASTFAAAPFRVSNAGALTATSVTITLPTLIAGGTFTKNSADASTTQNVAHGMSSTPRFVKFSWLVASGNSASFASGFYNGSVHRAIYWDETAMTQEISTAEAIYFAQGAATQSASVALDATNIVLTWTKVGAPTGTYDVMWEAFN